MLLNLPTDSSQNTVPDIELARRKLDWEPRIPIEEGLTRTLRYFEERMRMENRAYPFMSSGRDYVKRESDRLRLGRRSGRDDRLSGVLGRGGLL